MTDVFISYAHEDQAFVRRMTQALEAEGFSVWWDHTIPPGKTWNTYIARGIAEAKACIVVWSKHSVGSKWVLEEATLANNAEKLLPVAVDASAPPMGFLSLQAAQLSGWSGDTNNAQWRLLVGEVRGIAAVAYGGAAPALRSHSHYTPPQQPKRGPPWAIIAGAAAVIIGVLSFTMLTREAGQTTTALETAAADVITSTATTTQEPATDGLGELERTQREAARQRQQDAAEIERLRRERDQAIEAQRAQPHDTVTAESPVGGRWFGGYANQSGVRDETHYLEFLPNGTFQRTGCSVCTNLTGTWRQRGDRIHIEITSGSITYDGTIRGNTMSGTTRTNVSEGRFSYQRSP